MIITQYPVIFNFRDKTGWVLEKSVGTGRLPGSRRGLLLLTLLFQAKVISGRILHQSPLWMTLVTEDFGPFLNVYLALQCF